jgi:hypothetical protein
MFESLDIPQLLAWAIVALLAIAIFTAFYLFQKITDAYARFIFRIFSPRHIAVGTFIAFLLVAVVATLATFEMHGMRR